MALTCAELIAEIKALVGRGADSVLVTDTRAMRWLNEAQVDIIENVPGYLGTEFKSTSLACVSDQLAYSINDITGVHNDYTSPVAHVWSMYFIDGASSHKIDYKCTDDFDYDYQDPTSTDYSRDEPVYWTRRGSRLEVYPVPGEDEAGYTLRVHGSLYAKDFSATTGARASELNNADEGLIMFGVSRAWESIGNEEKSAIWKVKYDNWLSDYKEKNDVMYEWDWNIFDG